MNPPTVVAVVTRLYAAAGRRAGEVDLEVWGEALAALDDGLALEATRRLVREVDLAAHPPSPHQVIQVYRRLVTQQPALPPAPEEIVPPAEALANIERLRGLIRNGGPKRWS